MLGDGTCDTECVVLECLDVTYDYECIAGCTKAMMRNDVCNARDQRLEARLQH
jgi:hypothetical protein